MNREIALQILGQALGNLAWKVGASRDLANVEAAWGFIVEHLADPKPAEEEPVVEPTVAPEAAEAAKE